MRRFHDSGVTVEVAERMLELVHDLGDCQDSRQILIAAARHYRVLFGEFLVAALIADDPLTGQWRVLAIENPYNAKWGGLSVQQIPAGTDTDEIARRLGKEVTGWMKSDPALQRHLLENAESFAVADNVAAVRLAALTGAPCRCFLAAPWKRPVGNAHAWSILGYAEPRPLGADVLRLFETAVETTSRMAYYPSLVSFVQRQEQINHSIRRNIVHDLKTPITVVKGYAETMGILNPVEDAEMSRELLDGIIESCDRLLADLKDILEPVDGAYRPHREPFDLNVMLHKAVLAERHTLRARHHTIDLHAPGDHLTLNGDLRKLRRVVENLLSNAVKYSPGLDKTVLVQLEQVGNEAHIRFIDQGIGMEQESMDRVLAEGGRVADVSLGIEGSGFGLQSSQLVLRAHGGRLEATSRPGVGTTFTAIIPLDATTA